MDKGGAENTLNSIEQILNSACILTTLMTES